MKTTGEDIFKALENVDEHYIEECQQSGSGVKIKTVWKKWVAVAACGVIATVTGVMMFAGRSDKDIKVGAGQQASGEEDTLACKVPWNEYAMNGKYETFEYNDVKYVSMGPVDKSFLDSTLTTMTLEPENYETNQNETTKADIYSIKDLSPSVYLAVVFDDGSVAWYDDWEYSPDYKADMTLDDIINDVSLEKTARVDYAYNDAGMGRLRKYTNIDLSKLLDLLKDDNGSYNAVYEGDAYESDPDINLSVTNDDEYYIEGGITISFYVERLDVNGTAYFNANGDLYVQLFAGDKWEQLSTDVFAVTFLSLLENINQALIQAWHGNILAVMHQMYGVVGVIIITDVLAVACYKLYLTIRDRRIKDSLLTWLAIGVLAAVICLPIKVEALPVYMMILLLALYTAKPANGEPQVIETPRTEEREEELVEKEEMLEGVFII